METYSDSKAIFGIYRVNLHNRILISTWLDFKQKSFISDFLVSTIFFLKSLIKLFCLKSYNAIIVIFGICRVDLHNRILISTWLDDLQFLAHPNAHIFKTVDGHISLKIKNPYFFMFSPKSIPHEVSKKCFDHFQKQLPSLPKSSFKILGKN